VENPVWIFAEFGEFKGIESPSLDPREEKKKAYEGERIFGKVLLIFSKAFSNIYNSKKSKRSLMLESTFHLGEIIFYSWNFS